MAIKNNQTGFTLFEVLMVIFLFTIIALVTTNLFFSILKSTSKAELEKEVKQNGDFAMNVMERMIRNSRQVTDCPNPSGSLQIQNPDGLLTTLQCFEDEGSAKIASVSGSTQQFLTGKNVILGSNCALSTLSFSCRAGPPKRITISFTLTQKGTSSRPEEQARVSFQTTVNLRNY